MRGVEWSGRWTGRTTPTEQRCGYLDELTHPLDEAVPAAVCRLSHGFSWRVFLEGDRIVVPESRVEPQHASWGFDEDVAEIAKVA